MAVAVLLPFSIDHGAGVVIGETAIAGGVWLTRSAPPGSTVTQAGARRNGLDEQEPI